MLVGLFSLTAARSRGSESERWWQCAKLHCGDFPQSGQHEVDPEPLAKGTNSYLTTDKAVGEQAKQEDQGRIHRLKAPAYPTQRPGQLDIGTQLIGCRLATGGLLDPNHNRFELLQGACEATGKTIGEQTEGTVPLGAIPTRDPGSGRIDPRVGAVARKRATAARMQRTAL